jgi:hypothetical protein
MQNFAEIISFLKMDSWIVQVFVVVFLTLLLNFFPEKNPGKSPRPSDQNQNLLG